MKQCCMVAEAIAIAVEENGRRELSSSSHGVSVSRMYVSHVNGCVIDNKRRIHYRWHDKRKVFVWHVVFRAEITAARMNTR